MAITGFELICAPGARVLILGTMPGEESLRVGEYYANPRNSFWRIMGELFGFSIGASYDSRVAALKSHGVAVWDVLALCDRDGSLDSKIRVSTAIPNDFQPFLMAHRRIERVCFNGQKASDLFRRLVLPQLPKNEDSPPLLVLPSTSPANTHINLEHKVMRWKQVVKGIPTLP